MDTPKVVLIARVSDKKQRKALPAQKVRLLAYATERLKLPYSYNEFDESAFKGDRSKFNALVKGIEAEKQEQYVVFDKIDRFSRECSQDIVRIFKDLTKSGRVQMHFPHDNLVVTKDSPAMEWFQFDLGISLAAYFSRSNSDNLHRRQSQLAPTGKRLGMCALGYLNTRKGTIDNPIKTVTPDPDRAHLVVEMFVLRSNGMSFGAIAKNANEKRLRTRQGKRIQKKHVQYIIGNPFYYGKTRYKGQLYDHDYPRLIDYRLFYKCQRIGQARSAPIVNYDTLSFTFKGLIKCGRCGCSMSSFKAKGNVYLKCSGAKGKCGNTTTAQRLLLPQIEQVLSDIALPPKLLDKVVEELRQRHGRQQDHSQKQRLAVQREFDRVSDRLKKLTYERLDGNIPDELYTEMVREMTDQQHELSDQLDALSQNTEDFLISASYLLDLCQRAKSLFISSPEDLQQKLLKTILSNLVLDDKVLSYEVRDPFKTFLEIKNQTRMEPDFANNGIWCGSGDSNPWPRPWQGRALNN